MCWKNQVSDLIREIWDNGQFTKEMDGEVVRKPPYFSDFICTFCVFVMFSCKTLLVFFFFIQKSRCWKIRNEYIGSWKIWNEYIGSWTQNGLHLLHGGGEEHSSGLKLGLSFLPLSCHVIWGKIFNLSITLFLLLLSWRKKSIYITGLLSAHTQSLE